MNSPKGKPQLGLHVTLGTEVGQALDEFLEVHLTIVVVIKYIYHPPVGIFF